MKKKIKFLFLENINFKFKRKTHFYSRNYVCTYSIVFLLVFNPTTFWKTFELFALLFEFFHFHDINVIYFWLQFSHSVSAFNFIRICFFLIDSITSTVKHQKAFIEKLYLILYINYIWCNILKREKQIYWNNNYSIRLIKSDSD